MLPSIMHAVLSFVKKRYLIMLISGPAAALGAVWFSFHPDLAERWYSRAFYPFFQSMWAYLAKWLPFPLAEVLIAGTLIWLIFVIFRGIRRLVHPSTNFPRKQFLHRLGQSSLNCAALFSIAIAFFLLAWGYNYQRQSWALNHGWSAVGGDHLQIFTLAKRLAKELAADRARLPEAVDGRALSLEGSWTDDTVLKRVNRAWNAAALRDSLLVPHSAGAKRFLGSALMSMFSIGGVFIPWTGEALVNAGPADFSIPFAAAHEIAHQRGWAREDEANFMAFWVLQASPDADLRYSARASAFMYVAASLDGITQAEIADLRKALPTGFRRDQKGLEQYWNTFRGPLTDVGTAINDRYLKTQGQSEGIRSYGRMVDLLLAWNAH